MAANEAIRTDPVSRLARNVRFAKPKEVAADLGLILRRDVTVLCAAVPRK